LIDRGRGALAPIFISLSRNAVSDCRMSEPGTTESYGHHPPRCDAEGLARISHSVGVGDRSKSDFESWINELRRIGMQQAENSVGLGLSGSFPRRRSESVDRSREISTAGFIPGGRQKSGLDEMQVPDGPHEGTLAG